jgi:hypothetical protein
LGEDSKPRFPVCFFLLQESLAGVPKDLRPGIAAEKREKQPERAKPGARQSLATGNAEDKKD